MRKIIILLMSIAFVVIGVVLLISHFHAQKTQIAQTIAIIVRIDSELETDSDGYDTRYYYPVIKFTANNKNYEKRLPSGTADSTYYTIGQSIQIKYNPDNPEDFSKLGDNGNLFGGIVFIVLGTLFIFLTLAGRM